MNNIYKILIVLALSIAHAALAVNYVAVTELLANASVQNTVSEEELRYLTDELRKQADMALPRGEYAILYEKNARFGIDYVSKGTVGKFGRKFTISVMLYKIGDGKPVSSIHSESNNIEGLLDIVRSEAKPMFQSILGIAPQPPFIAPAAPAAPAAAPVEVPPVPPAESSIPANVDVEESSGIGAGTVLGIGLGLAGAGFIVYGITQNSEYDSQYKKYKNAEYSSSDEVYKKKAENAKSSRNFGYILGGVLLATGITITIAF